MLESKAYKTYYAFASGEKTPKLKYIRKKADSNTSLKQKPVETTKGNGVDTQSKVHDEQHIKTIGADEGTEEDKDDENDSKDKSDGNDDDDANDDNNQEGDDTNDDDKETDNDSTESDRIKIPILNQSSTKYYEEEENIDDEEMMDEEEDDEVTKELYDEVNVNLGNEDSDMTNADQKDDELVQSSFVSFDFTSKLLNLENSSPANNEIASLLDTIARHTTSVPEITSSFTITIPPPPPFFNPLLQQATPTPTPTTSEATTSFTSLLDFSFVFKFNERVANLEKISVSDFATPVKEKNVTESLEAAVLAKASSQPKSTYEAAASLSEFELTKILLEKMEESKSHLRADYKKKLYDALVESYNTDKYLFNTYGEVFTLNRSRDDSDKDQDPFAGSERGTKRRKSSKEAESSKDSRSKEKKSSRTSKDASQSQHKYSSKYAYAEEPSHTVDDTGVQQDQEFDTGNNDEQPTDKEVSKED
ncbi:hypothetical protein Tco_0800740 [Tanacetum coccineum]|uniref:Uncharacterized protein n=1 Tax=Tanacetum coccineum TaxID=301880 RepID=A0ABQ4ZXC2_9ASTR